jgi:carbonic anhydrase/SulP family sulfate permease
MWAGGRSQFIPFIATVVAIVLTDLLVGVLVGMIISTGFVLWSSVRRPIRRVVEKHLGGEVVHIELANQVSFLNRAALARALDEVPTGGHILLDARSTDYIDPDVLDLLRDFKAQTGPARNIEVSMLGFRSRYQLIDQIQYVDCSTRELQNAITPEQVVQILKDGHERFRSGRRLTRDLGRQVNATADGQHPLAVVLSCMDSRTPIELIFDLGVGDIFSIRIAGNITSPGVIGSVEYGCAIAGAKLILVMGHTRCGAVTAAVRFKCQANAEAMPCDHLGYVIHDIQDSIDSRICSDFNRLEPAESESLVNEVARRNVRRSVEMLLAKSATLSDLVREGRVGIAGAMYDVATGKLEVLMDESASALTPEDNT